MRFKVTNLKHLIKDACSKKLVRSRKMHITDATKMFQYNIYSESIIIIADEVYYYRNMIRVLFVLYKYNKPIIKKNRQ